MTAAVASVLARPGWHASLLSWQSLLAWVALVPLFVALRGASRRAGMGLAIVYATVLFVGGVEPWLAPAAARYFGLSPARAVLMTLPPLALLGAAHGVGLGVVLLARPRRGPWDVIFCAAAWVAWEAVRTRIFPYYPGPILGLSQHATTPVLQVASLTGIAGVSFLVVACNVGLASLIVARDRAGCAAAVTGVLLAVAAAGVGGMRVRPEPFPGPKVAAIDVDAASAAEGTLEAYVARSDSLRDRAPRLFIWPESALAGDPTRDRVLFAALERFVAAGATPLLAGGLGSVLRADRRGFVEFNSAHLVIPGNGIASYHKRVLVPFAEGWPRFLGPPPATLGTVEPGREPTLLHLDHEHPFGVLICFEIAEPSGARELARRGAGFLVNLTNDAWFAEAPHIPWAAVRAVETGLPVVRAANAGVSGVYDRFGRPWVTGSSGGGAAALLIDLPAAALTPYARRGDLFLLACLAAVLLVVVVRRR